MGRSGPSMLSLALYRPVKSNEGLNDDWPANEPEPRKSVVEGVSSRDAALHIVIGRRGWQLRFVVVHLSHELQPLPANKTTTSVSPQAKFFMAEISSRALYKIRSQTHACSRCRLLFVSRVSLLCRMFQKDIEWWSHCKLRLAVYNKFVRSIDAYCLIGSISRSSVTRCQVKKIKINKNTGYWSDFQKLQTVCLMIDGLSMCMCWTTLL